MKIKWINNKRGKVLLHVLAWLIIFSLPYLLTPAYDENRPKNADSNGFFYLNTLTEFFWLGVFYLNALVLTESFFYKKKYLQYALLLLFIFGLIMLIHALLFSLLISTKPFILINSVGFNLPTYILTIAVSTTYQMVQDKIKTDNILQVKQEENLKSELSFLRSQISPHFIFNVLNNMVALVRLKSDQLEPTIMKLSSLMQYMLYETDEEKVLLLREAEYLQSYIDLQQQRVGKKMLLTTLIEIEDKGYTIEPMLIIPFVENAFKHGVGMIEKPQINISLTTKEKVLFFSICNKFNKDTKELKDKTSGIGLTNVCRRLNLLYHNQYELSITKEDNWFNVSLKLTLHV